MNPIPISRKSFQKIIQFYLFETPVRTYDKTAKKEYGATADQPDPKYNYTFKKVSKRGITFADRHLDGAKLIIPLSPYHQSTTRYHPSTK